MAEPAASLCRAARFLQALYSGVERYYEDGLQDFEMTPRLCNDLSRFRHRYDFRVFGRIVSFIYLQVENERF